MKNSNVLKLIVFGILMLSGTSILYSQTACKSNQDASQEKPAAGVLVKTIALPDLVPTPDAPDPPETDLNTTLTGTESQ